MHNALKIVANWKSDTFELRLLMISRTAHPQSEQINWFCHFFYCLFISLGETRDGEMTLESSRSVRLELNTLMCQKFWVISNSICRKLKSFVNKKNSRRLHVTFKNIFATRRNQHNRARHYHLNLATKSHNQLIMLLGDYGFVFGAEILTFAEYHFGEF